MIVPVLTAGTLLASFAMPAAADATDIRVAYLRLATVKPALSLALRPAADDGLAGARLGIDDDNTTGRLLGQRFILTDVKLAAADDPAAATAALADDGVALVIADLPADKLILAADAGRQRGLTLFNVGAPDDRLRQQDCRANLIHVAPSHAMLADALAQYLVWKQWRRWFLVAGSHADDKLYADALRRAATRFGARIVEERVFEDRGGARQTDSGVAQIQRQIPVFTQNAPAYDALVTADESEVFAGHFPFRTWDPRPVAGSAGLVPTSWDPSFDQWGAAQLQSRFVKRNARAMTARDLQAWSAARMIGESATRARSTEPTAIVAHVKGPDFAVAAFKGQKLTLRPWNLQLRQPILLADGRTVVSVSPQQGFLHQVSELDTLGLDRPESRCRLE